MKIRGEEPMKMLINNKSTISLAKNPVTYGRSKHIDTRFYFLRDQVNILTKPLKDNQFKMSRDMIRV
ncbi:Copia protein, partial [Mucuna pruriens]